MTKTITDNYGDEYMQDPWHCITRLDLKASEHEARLAVHEHRITTAEVNMGSVITTLT